MSATPRLWHYCTLIPGVVKIIAKSFVVGWLHVESARMCPYRRVSFSRLNIA